MVGKTLSDDWEHWTRACSRTNTPTTIYFNLAWDHHPRDYTLVLCHYSHATLPAFGFWGMAVVFFSLSTSWNAPKGVSERYGGLFGGGWLLVEITTPQCCKRIYSVSPGLVEPAWAFSFVNGEKWHISESVALAVFPSRRLRYIELT